MAWLALCEQHREVGHAPLRSASPPRSRSGRRARSRCRQAPRASYTIHSAPFNSWSSFVAKVSKSFRDRITMGSGTGVAMEGAGLLKGDLDVHCPRKLSQAAMSNIRQTVVLRVHGYGHPDCRGYPLLQLRHTAFANHRRWQARGRRTATVFIRQPKKFRTADPHFPTGACSCRTATTTPHL